MELNKIKEKIQKEAANIWVENNYKGTFEFATGVGKTFAALHCILKIPKNSTILFLFEISNRENTIKNDIKKFDKIYSTELKKDYNLIFACYQSAYKWKNKSFDLVIADEVHDSLTLKYFKFYENNSYNKIIGLSATIDKKAKIDEDNDSEVTKGDLLNSIAPIIKTISQSNAIELGLIASYEILIYYHNLDKTNKNMIGGTKKNPFKTTEVAMYEYYDKLFKKALFMPENKHKKFAIRNASSKRAKILYEAPSKFPIVRKIIDNLNTFKFIIFGNSLNALRSISKYVVDSRNTEDQNNKIIEDFQKGKINEIASFKMLKQGANLKNANITILHSYYSVSKDYIQRVGRILRLDENTYNAVIIIATVGTQEIVWLNKMTQDIEAPILGFHKLEDLIKHLKTKQI